VGRRDALGWLGAVVCSVALIVAGGLVLSSVAVHRYLQASNSALHRGEVQDTGPTPPPGEVESIDRVVTSITGMPGVATASCEVDTGAPSGFPIPTAATPTPRPTESGGFSYQISVIMDSGATAAQAADVVFSMTKQLQDSHVDLELSAPQGSGHAESVIDYRDAFDAPVSRSTVAAISQAVSVATTVPGVTSVHVTVPYTWNIASGDLQVQFAPGAGRLPESELENALSRTALAGVDWSASR
jgi:hypothetical protein